MNVLICEFCGFRTSVIEDSVMCIKMLFAFAIYYSVFVTLYNEINSRVRSK